MSKLVQINMRLSDEMLERIDGVQRRCGGNRHRYIWCSADLAEHVSEAEFDSWFGPERQEPVQNKPTVLSLLLRWIFKIMGVIPKKQEGQR